MKRRIPLGVVLCFAFAFSSHAHAQSSCLAKDIADEILAKAGIPTNYVQLLLLGLTPEVTADASVDQVTQLSVTFANKSAKDLVSEDNAYVKAIGFVNTMPPTEDTQNCVSNMEKIRKNIKTELAQRGKENIPDSLTPNQFQALKH